MFVEDSEEDTIAELVKFIRLRQLSRTVVLEVPSPHISFEQHIELFVCEAACLRYAQICPYPADCSEPSKEEPELAPEVG